MLGQAAAYAASLDDALSHFTTDDFSETSTGISDLATSGSPRAEIIIRALQDGRLLFSAERKTVYVKDEAGKLTDAATGNKELAQADDVVAKVAMRLRARAQ